MVTVELAGVRPVHPLDNVSTEDVGDIVTKSEIKKAYDNEEMVKKSKTLMVQISFTLAQYLSEILVERQYKILGFDTFDKWCESPQIDIDRSSAYRYVKLYKAYIESGAFTVKEVEDKGISKLEVILPMITPTDKDWKQKKKQVLADLELPRKELIQLVNEGRISLQRAAEEAMSVKAKYEVMKGGEKGKSDSEVVSTVKSSRKGEVVAPSRPENPQKSLGIAGWYELVPMDDKPQVHGKTVAGVYLNAAKVVISGTRIFVDVE